MTKKRLRRIVSLALGFAGALSLATRGEAQSCYTSTGRFYDDCNDSSAFYPPKVATFLTVGSKSLMLINSNFKLLVFDLANPALPTQIGSPVMPFPPGCGLPFGCGQPHFQYLDTLQPVSAAAIGSTGYVFVPLASYGWDMVKVTASGTNVTLSWFNTGYHPPGNGGPYLYGALFTDGSQFYLVGQMLDSSSVAAGDKSIRIYSLGATPPADLYNSIGPGVRVPVGGANDPEPYKSALLIMGKHQFFVANVGSKRILMVYSTGFTPSSNNWIAFFDITNPANPVPAGFISYAADPSLFSGAVAFEAEANRFWVAKPAGGTAATVTIYGYQLTEGGGSASLGQVSGGTWPLGSQTGAGIPVVAAGQGLLVFGWMQVGKAFAVSASGQLSPLPDEPGYTDLSVNLEEPCQYWDLARGYTGLGVFPGSDGVYFYRGAMKEGRTIRVATACLALSPTAQLNVANSSAEEAAGASCGAADADGFPGDSFVFGDSSVGSITYKSLAVCPGAAGCTTPVFSASWSQAGGWTPGLTWNSSTSDTGVFAATLTVGNGQDPDSTTSKTVRLCANPQAALAVSPQASSYLQNQSVTLQAGSSSGHPTGYHYYVW